MKISIKNATAEMSDVDKTTEELGLQHATVASEKETAENNPTLMVDAKKENDNNRASEGLDSNSCRICFEPFDKNDHHQSCITKCFHTFCYSCLNSLTSKKCPNCREPFRMKAVRKLF